MNIFTFHIRMTVFFLCFHIAAGAQDYNVYKASDASLLQLNDTDRMEQRLERVVISLSNNATLRVRCNIPLRLTSLLSADSITTSASLLPCTLTLRVDLWDIQNNLTSAKNYTTQGLLTVNDSAKNVKVDYMVTPSTTAQKNDFMLSMNIQFRPSDFNFDGKLPNARFIIRITNGVINRI